MQIDAHLYGQLWANDYDNTAMLPQEETDAAINHLDKLAQAHGNNILELAAGTGRISIPLAERGHNVTATDGSPDMLKALMDKPGGDKITTRVEDMTCINDTNHYDLICVLFSSLFCLHTQQQQLDVFATVAEHLAPNGVFVVEAVLIDPREFVEARPLTMTNDRLLARFGTYDVYTQLLNQHYLIGDVNGQVTVRPDTGRFITIAELDLMARIAGLELVERNSSWHGNRNLNGPGNYISRFCHTT